MVADMRQNEKYSFDVQHVCSLPPALAVYRWRESGEAGTDFFPNV